MQSNSPLLLLIWAEAVYWNRFAEQLYGWSAEEAIGQQITQLTTPEPSTRQADEIMSELRQGKSWTGEFTVQRKDGAAFPAQVTNSPVYDDKQRLIGIVGISSDITERKPREQVLRESENKYRVLIEQASDGIHTYDMHGNIIETNSRFCEMLGYTPEELLRLNVKDLVPAEDLAADPIRFDELQSGKRFCASVGCAFCSRGCAGTGSGSTTSTDSTLLKRNSDLKNGSRSSPFPTNHASRPERFTPLPPHSAETRRSDYF